MRKALVRIGLLVGGILLLIIGSQPFIPMFAEIVDSESLKPIVFRLCLGMGYAIFCLGVGLIIGDIFDKRSKRKARKEGEL